MPTTLPAGTSTYKDYLAISDDERHELLNGELVMVPSPSYAHQAVQTRLSWRLAAFVETHDLGECLNAPLDVFFSEHDVVQPDIVFIARNRRADMIRTDGRLHGAPDLVVEVLSPTTAATDRGTKHDLYERHGVQEYWLVDPARQTIELLARNGNVLETLRTFGADDTLRSPLLPDFEPRLADIFPA